MEAAAVLPDEWRLDQVTLPTQILLEQPFWLADKLAAGGIELATEMKVSTPTALPSFFQ